MPLSDEDVQFGRFVAERPEDGVVAVLLPGGSVGNLLRYDPATKQVVHAIPEPGASHFFEGGGGIGGPDAGAARAGEVGVTAPQYRVGDVRRYGAVPLSVNPAADSTAALRNADTSARVLGATVFVPAGQWRVTGTVKVTALWRGEGRLQSELLTEVNDGSDTLQIDNRDHWALEHLRVRGNITPGQRPNTTALGVIPMVDGDGASRFVLRSFEAIGCKQGIRLHGWITDSSDVWASYCDFGFIGKEVNGGRLGLFVENCGEGFWFDFCDGVDLSLLCEGCTVRGGRLTRCRGITIDGCYFESNTGPHLLIGVPEGAETGPGVRCEDITLSAGKFVGSTTRAYAITADYVDGLTLQHPMMGMGSNYTNILVTPNARRVKASGKPYTGWLHDDAAGMVPPYNYCPNPTFRYGLRGFHSVTLARATATVETAITRTGGAALRVTAQSGQAFGYALLRLPDSIRDAFRGRSVRVLVPLWIPNLPAFAQPNPSARPAIGVSTGAATTASQNAQHVPGHWNMMEVVAAVPADAALLAVVIFVNNSPAVLSGAEYVVAGGVVVAEESVDADELRAGRWTPHPLAGQGIGPNWFGHGTAAPTSGSIANVVGDRVWNTQPNAGTASYWECTAAGAPGTWIARGLQGLTRPTFAAARGDASFNVQKGLTEDLIRVVGPSTFDHTVTLLPAGAVVGDQVEILRTDPSPYRWRVQQSVNGVMTTLVDLAPSSLSWVKLTFDGTLWFLSGYSQSGRKRVAPPRTLDGSINVQKGITEDVIRLAGPTTGPRVVNVFTAGALAGDEFEFVRIDPSPYAWTIQQQGGAVLKALPGSTLCRAKITFDGTNWFLSAYSTH